MKLWRAAPKLGRALVEISDETVGIAGVRRGGEGIEHPMQSPFAFPQRLLDLLALGDVFREPGNARDVPLLVLNGEGATADPADRAVRPDHPELRVREHTLPVLLQALERSVPIVRMDAL